MDITFDGLWNTCIIQDQTLGPVYKNSKFTMSLIRITTN